MEERYKDWEIKYEEEAETFVATDQNENTLKSQKLKELKKKIDKFGFKRIPVICRGYSHYDSNLCLGEITSIAERASHFGNPEVWVSFVDKDGSKGRTECSIDYLYKQNEQNLRIFKENSKLVEEKRGIEKKLEELDEKLECIKKEDIGLDVEAE